MGDESMLRRLPILATIVLLVSIQSAPVQAQFGDFLEKLKDTVEKEVEDVKESLIKDVEETEQEVLDEVEDTIDVTPNNNNN